MSQRRKNQRARHEAQEEKKAKTIVNGIFFVLVALAIVFLIISVYNA